MSALETDYPVPAPVEINQPCSEACACFQRLATDGWSDYGLCTNPRSPFSGFPVSLGQECPHYRPTRDNLQSRQA